MFNLKLHLNYAPKHDTSMIVPRHYYHGKNIRKNGEIYGNYDTMTLFPVKVLMCAYARARAYTYYHTIIFLKKIRNNYHKRLRFLGMTLFRKSIMQVSWPCHSVIAEDLVAVLILLCLVCLLWQVAGGAAC